MVEFVLYIDYIIHSNAMVARAGLPLQVRLSAYSIPLVKEAAFSSSMPHLHTCISISLSLCCSLQDLEFVQFHPTGIYGAGCLITEGQSVAKVILMW